MKVFDLICREGHRFEGWFASTEAFTSQCEATAVRCPLCDSGDIERSPSAPRLRRAAHDADDGAAGASARRAAAQTVDALRKLVAAVENVGPRFAEEARRIHYQEIAPRAIRGTATDRERRELDDEGIETLSIALPPALTDELQ